MVDERYQALADAIVMQAVRDFRSAYRRMKRHPHSTQAVEEVEELTQFFCSGYFCILTDLDGRAFLEGMARRINAERG